jgi:O-antigen/teichoic acid export membrane protein
MSSLSEDAIPVGRISRIGLVRNIGWNWAGTATQILLAFILAPFLIHRLGDANYGLWVLIGSLTEGLGLLDLGVRTSVGRQLAFARSKRDRDAVNATLNASLAALTGIGVLICLVSVLVAFYLPHIADIPVGDVYVARVAMLLVGFGFALHTFLGVFDATLWASQRFDTLNMIDIPVSVARTALMYVFVSSGYGLVALAMVTLITIAVAGITKAVFCFRINQDLEIGLSHVRRSFMRALFDFGKWNFVVMVGVRIRVAVVPLLISSGVGLAALAPFSIVTRLLTYALVTMQAGTGVLTSVATSLDAQQMGERLQRLVLEGGRVCFAVALFLSIWLVLLGPFFISLWIGPRLAEAASVLLIILVCGEFLPMAQTVSSAVITATARHRVLAFASVLEAVVAISLGAVLMSRYQMIGLCLALATAATVLRGLSILIFTCRFTKITVASYLKAVLIPALAVAALPAMILWALVVTYPPHTWWQLVLYSSMFATSFAVAAIPLLGYGQVMLEGRRLFDRARGALESS